MVGYIRCVLILEKLIGNHMVSIKNISVSYNVDDKVDTVYGLGEDNCVYWWNTDTSNWTPLQTGQ